MYLAAIKIVSCTTHTYLAAIQLMSYRMCTLSESDMPLGFSRVASAWNAANFPTAPLILSQRLCRDLTLLSGFDPLFKLYLSRILSHMRELFCPVLVTGSVLISSHDLTRYVSSSGLKLPNLIRVTHFFVLFRFLVCSGESCGSTSSTSMFSAGGYTCCPLLPGCPIATWGGTCWNPWGNQDEGAWYPYMYGFQAAG